MVKTTAPIYDIVRGDANSYVEQVLGSEHELVKAANAANTQKQEKRNGKAIFIIVAVIVIAVVVYFIRKRKK